MDRPSITLVFAHGILGWGDRALRKGMTKEYFHGVRQFYLKEYGTAFHVEILTPTVSPADRVRHRAQDFTTQVTEALRARPDVQIHIIAHSMGGLDARWALAKGGLADRTASLTTIGTPHHGTSVANLAARFMPVLHPAGKALAWLYEHAQPLWIRRQGGEPVDPMEFLHRVLDGFRVSREQSERAVHDLTIEGMARFNAELAESEYTIRTNRDRAVDYFAYGGDVQEALPEDRLQAALLRPTHGMLKCRGSSGERTSANDGMVSVWSAHLPWDQAGAQYVGTIPFGHFLQVNWRFPDTRQEGTLSDALKSVYRDVMENIIKVEQRRTRREESRA
jgi:pimeloyl-ACP methyl ester carboxylesterase